MSAGGFDLVAALRACRARIENPERWIQGRAEDSEGRCCAIGTAAVTLDAHGHYRLADDVRRALDRAAFDMGFGRGMAGKRAAAVLNDTTDHATVLRMFDVAIERIEATRCPA